MRPVDPKGELLPEVTYPVPPIEHDVTCVPVSAPKGVAQPWCEKVGPGAAANESPIAQTRTTSSAGAHVVPGAAVCWYVIHSGSPDSSTRIRTGSPDGPGRFSRIR